MREKYGYHPPVGIGDGEVLLRGMLEELRNLLLLRFQAGGGVNGSGGDRKKGTNFVNGRYFKNK